MGVWVFGFKIGVGFWLVVLLVVGLSDGCGVGKCHSKGVV